MGYGVAVTFEVGWRVLQNKNGRGGGVIRAFSVYFSKTFDIKIKQ